MNKEYIVIAFTENQIGVLNRITACYLRRKINIESLRVSESAIKGISMFVISAITTEELIDKTVRQIRNIIDVIEADWHDSADLLQQETALFKISTARLGRSGMVEALQRQWNMRIIELNTKYVVLEKTGLPEEIDALRAELDTDGLLETFSRSGSVVMLPDTPSCRPALGNKLDF